MGLSNLMALAEALRPSFDVVRRWTEQKSSPTHSAKRDAEPHRKRMGFGHDADKWPVASGSQLGECLDLSRFARVHYRQTEIFC